MAKRKAVSTRTRFEVFKRDEFACQYCGRTPPDVRLTIDHITPVAAGGDNDPLNLITACTDCNAGKSDRPLTAAMPGLKDQIADRKERETQLAEYNTFLMELRERRADLVREVGWYWHNKFMEEQDAWVFSGGRKSSAENFLDRLPLAQILDAIDVAFRKYPARGEREHPNCFKYFCGVCWHKIRGTGPAANGGSPE